MPEKSEEPSVPAPSRHPGIAPTSKDSNGSAAKRNRALVIVAVIVVLGGIYAYHLWSFGRSHAVTDDAQIASDSVDIAPQVSGTVAKVFVNDNQLVKQGDLLVKLDDRSLVASVDQARANLEEAQATAQGAGVNIALTQETGSAQVRQATGVVDQANAGVRSAESDVSKAAAGIDSAIAGEGAARANISASAAGVANARAGVSKAQAALNGAKAMVANASAQVKAADAAVTTAQSAYDTAAKDAARYQALLSQGAVSQQETDAKQAAADSAKSNLEGSKQQADAARASVSERQAEVTSAEEGVRAALSGVDLARANLSATQSQRAGTTAGYQSALAQRRASLDAVRNAQAKAAQALGQLAQAKTAGTSVDVSKTARLQAIAKVAQARAALEAAKLQLSYTQIFAPRDGRVTKKHVDEGELVQPGSPLMTLVDESDVWLVANFKETQLPGITVGKTVDVDVDAVSHKTFHGVVNSIQAGTGAAFTLLPPDNATGNFTKVVQRVPVKITFDSGQSDLADLRTGMSATATVDLDSK